MRHRNNGSLQACDRNEHTVDSFAYPNTSTNLILSERRVAGMAGMLFMKTINARQKVKRSLEIEKTSQ